MKNRTRAYYREMRHKAICRKRYIDCKILENKQGLKLKLLLLQRL